MVSYKTLFCVTLLLATNAFADNESVVAEPTPCIGGQISIDGLCAMPIKNGLDESEKCIFNGSLGANSKGVYVCQNSAWLLLAPANQDALATNN